MFTSVCTGRKANIGSFAMSIKEIEEIPEFYREKNLNPIIEVVKMNFVNKSFKRMEKNDVSYN